MSTWSANACATQRTPLSLSFPPCERSMHAPPDPALVVSSMLLSANTCMSTVGYLRLSCKAVVKPMTPLPITATGPSVGIDDLSFKKLCRYMLMMAVILPRSLSDGSARVPDFELELSLQPEAQCLLAPIWSSSRHNSAQDTDNASCEMQCSRCSRR